MDIVSLLAQERSLQKCNTVTISADISEVATALAIALSDVFPSSTMIEVIKSGDNSIIFRDDYSYYFKSGQECIPYNPFNEEEIVIGDVYCNELLMFYLSQDTVEKLKQTWFYQTVANPLLYEVIADYLTFRLNEEQPWAKLHSRCKTHLAQNYVNLDKLVAQYVPELSNDYLHLMHDISSEKESFIRTEQDKRTREISESKGSYGELAFINTAYALHMYEVRGKQYENIITQDFCDRQEVQSAFNEISVIIGRIIALHVHIELTVAERSLKGAFGYDVYQAVIENNRLVVKNLGDYRILHWELSK